VSDNRAKPRAAGASVATSFGAGGNPDLPSAHTAGRTDSEWRHAERPGSAGKENEYEVELRVHGVSGTPPESMLGAKSVVQIAGDDLGRFYRPSDNLRNPVKPDEDSILEGYHWGQFTAGSWQQGLWLVLIPFGLVNAAAFMLPDPNKEGKCARILHSVSLSLIRIVGVGLTFVFAFSGTALLVGHVGPRGEELAWLGAAPAWALPVLTSVGSAALILGLWAMGRVPKHLQEAPAHGSLGDSIAASSGGAGGGPALGLCRKAFYLGRPDAPTLRTLHLAMGFMVVALIILTSADLPVGSLNTLSDFVIRGAWFAASICAVTIALLGDPEASLVGCDKHERWHITAHWIARGLLCTSVLLLVFGSATLIASGEMKLNETQEEHYEEYAKGMVYAMVLTLCLLGLSNASLALATRQSRLEVPKEFRAYAKGCAPWVAASLGLFLGAGYAAALVLFVADVIDKPSESQVLYRVSYAWGLTVGAGAVMGSLFIAWIGVSYFRRKRRNDQRSDNVRSAYQRLWSEDAGHCRTVPRLRQNMGVWEEDSDWRESYNRIAMATQIADLKKHFANGAVILTLLGSILVAAASIEMWGSGRDLRSAFGELSEQNPNNLEHGFSSPLGEDPSKSSNLWSDFGIAALTALAAGLVLLGRRGITKPEQRRGINVFWDVISFWPHSSHPFVPPPYSQTAIPQVAARLKYHLGVGPVEPLQGSARNVVLAAHSQGSLIALAAVLWLKESELRRVGILTYGSQLQIAFPRAFPGYVDFHLIGAVSEAVQNRWVNLYRHTDPLAGPVLSWQRGHDESGRPSSQHIGSPREGCGTNTDCYILPSGRRESGNDWRLLDPIPADNQRMLVPLLPMAGHSGFPDSPDWADAVRRVRPHGEELPRSRCEGCPGRDRPRQ
jgi:hypothetical protein